MLLVEKQAPRPPAEDSTALENLRPSSTSGRSLNLVRTGDALRTCSSKGVSETQAFSMKLFKANGAKGSYNAALDPRIYA